MEIKVPPMGESITEATIGNIIKSSGERVALDEEIVELETDKINQVLYAPQAGVVNWSVKNGDVVKIGQAIGTVEQSNEYSKEERTAPEDLQQKNLEQKTPSQKKSEKLQEANSEAERDDVKEKDRDLESSKPTLETFEHPKNDVRASRDDYIQEIIQAPSLDPKAPSKPLDRSLQSKKAEEGEEKKGARETRKKMSKIRKIISSRLVEVKQQTAMLTTFNEIDMTAIMQMREKNKENFMKQNQVRLGLMSFFIKATVSALKAIPEVNAYIDNDDIVYRNYYDIGVAVGTEKGVIVPVIRNCDTLSFANIEQVLENYAKQAREGGLLPDDLRGGGFTITNGGTYGSLLSTPIINPPQSAILGIHKIIKRAVVVDDAIVIRQMMYVALSYDHRIIDGKEAVTFLVHIKNLLEDPARMLLELN